MPYLYLDTARLGQTSPSALQTQIDFARLTSEQPSSLYFDRFLANGFETVPNAWAQAYPSLQCWGGISELKNAIKRVALAPVGHDVAIANRSTLIMRAAARIMFRVCDSVLTTDCSWPAYQAELLDVASRSNRDVSCIAIRSSVLDGNVDAQQLVQRIKDQYDASGCDGLFLPAVDNLGVRLPVREIVKAVESIRKPKFVLIDGAQALGHLPEIDCHDICDLFLAGCHKWLRAYFPLGIAIYGRNRSREFIKHYLSHQHACEDIDDPLLRFSHELENVSVSRYSETVNIGPMFTCRAAIEDAMATQSTRNDRWNAQATNAAEVRRIGESAHWRVRSPDVSLRSGIVLLARRTNGSTFDPNALRRDLAESGVIASTYEDGTVRLSMPQAKLLSEDFDQIEYALSHVGHS